MGPAPLFIASVTFEVLYGLDPRDRSDDLHWTGRLFGGLVVAIAHVVLRRNLYVRTRFVDRALVVVLLSGAVAAAYVGLVAMIGLLVLDMATAASLAAAGAAALLLTPIRGAAQRATNRVVYGSARDPFAIVDALVAKLDAALDEPTTATAIVTAISSATRLPHVALELGGTVCAEVGIADTSTVRTSSDRAQRRVARCRRRDQTDRMRRSRGS